MSDASVVRRLQQLAGHTRAAAIAVTPAAAVAAAAHAAADAEADALFTAEVRRDGPGCAVCVVRDGATLYSKGFGLASLEHGVPIAPVTVFDVGSVSKQFTAAAIATLALAGKLSLTDPVFKHLPAFPDYVRFSTDFRLNFD